MNIFKKNKDFYANWYLGEELLFVLARFKSIGCLVCNVEQRFYANVKQQLYGEINWMLDPLFIIYTYD